jgi:copper resistance protein D
MDAWLQPVLRALHYAALIGLFGWTAFRVIGLRKLDGLPLERGNTVLFAASIAAPVLSLVLMLTSIAAMMGVSVTALDGAMTQAMVLGTDMGRAFLIRAGLLIAAVIVLLSGARTAATRPILAICFGGALLTLGSSGHAAATDGVVGLLHRLNNGVHLLAAGLWVGAIGWFLHLTRLSKRDAMRVPAQQLMAVMHGFAPLGMALVGAVAITGLANAHLIFGLERTATVLTSGYGQLLAAKVVLVVGMLAFGAHNARIARRAMPSVETPGRALAALRQSLAGEIALAVVVIGLVAVLGTLSPIPM